MEVLLPGGEAEEVRTVDFVYFYALVYVQAFYVVGSGDFVVLAGGDAGLVDNAYGRGLHGTSDEEHDGEQYAYLYGHGQIDYDGEEEGQQEHCDVALLTLEQVLE